MLFKFNRLTLSANIFSLQFTEISEYQPSSSYRATFTVNFAAFAPLPRWPPRSWNLLYISLLILTFLNRCISVRTSLINTKLGNLVNLGVLFRMWTKVANPIIYRLVPSLSRFESGNKLWLLLVIHEVLCSSPDHSVSVDGKFSHPKLKRHQSFYPDQEWMVLNLYVFTTF